MLVNLHVKNFALIDEADVDFGSGLNILTGETGAGKSILIDSVNAALGSRLKTDVIGREGDSAYIELLFSIDSPEKKQALKELDIDTDFDSIILSRRIVGGKSIHKINDETVTAARVRAAAELLIDIHGQHEHQSLTQKKKQLEILDRYAGNENLLEELAALYHDYKKKEEALAEFSVDEESRRRELDFLKYEVNELEAAAVGEGEKEELTDTFRRYRNSARLASSVSDLMLELADANDSVSDRMDRAVKAARDAVSYDGSLSGLLESLETAEDVISGIYRDAEDYARSLRYDPEDYNRISDRLDEINHLEQKYGSGYEALQAALTKRQGRIEELEHFDERCERAREDLARAEESLKQACGRLHERRAAAVPGLTEAITDTLRDLNFLDTRFVVDLRELSDYTAHGRDEVTFVIALNPGEPLKQLSEVASGGELSRIMLGIKAVLSDRDETPTLIFDEIDAGISGRTAQLVSQKLNVISKHAQVICITHLPQIAAMADVHFCIEKSASKNRTVTSVTRLSKEESVTELARLLGGAEITDRVMENAREMKALAERVKG